MAKSTRVITKKRPPVTGTLIGLRLQPALLAAVDRFAADQNAPSRPDAIRQLLADDMIRLGYLDTSSK